MTKLFEDRERAAEYGFAHAQELRFLAARGGVQALAGWAAGRMGLADADAYAETLVAALVGGASEADIIARVDGDLRRAGAPDAAAEAGAVLTRATADAAARVEGLATDRAAAARAPAWSAAPEPTPHPRNGFWGWPT